MGEDPAGQASEAMEQAAHVNDATAVIVNYNSGTRLGPLLDVLEKEVAAVVVVDNASSDGSLAGAEGRSSTSIIRNPDNRGFAAAVNQGAARATGRWLLLVNPDAHALPGQVTELLSDLPTEVAAVAPLQVDGYGRPLAETGGYEPTLLRYLVWALIPSRWHRRMGPWLAPPFPNGDAELDWVSGAMLGLRRDAFERLGGLDEKYFLYHEDVDFARRARRSGYRILCRGAVRLHHEVAHGDPARRVIAGLRSIESLSLEFTGRRRRALGLILGVGFGLRALVGSATQRAGARAALPACADLAAGRPIGRQRPSAANGERA